MDLKFVKIVNAKNGYDLMPSFDTEIPTALVKRPMSTAFHGFVRRLHLASQSGDPVLLAGEVGTGKRQSASTIHNVGARSNGNFVQVDCLGLKEAKFEIEMLGSLNHHNHQLRQGAVALAEGGTLYLHEVGELPAACQTLLLRLVESNTYSPVNSNDTYNSDFRLITSSSQDLAAMVDHGKFRNDLLHHINTLTIRSPSLNERRDDIAELAKSIMVEIPQARLKQLSPDAMSVLCHHKYTANILELRNIIHRLVCTFESETFSGLQVVQAIHAGTPSSKSERVIENQSQRSMLPDFNGYLSQVKAESNGLGQSRFESTQEEQKFNVVGQSPYASTTYHIFPKAASTQGPINASGLNTTNQKNSADHVNPYKGSEGSAWGVGDEEDEEGGDDDEQAFTALKAKEREYIRRLVEFCDGDKKKAAEIAGVTLRTLYRKLKV